VRLSARVDYALRAVAELGAVGQPAPLASERIAKAQEIPPKFLESILLQLRRGGIVHAQRGPEGGYRLARPAAEITLADVIRVIDGPLAHVRGQRPEALGYHGAARALQEVWIALRANERQILEQVTVADVAADRLPERVRELAADPRAWE
jgi:Rrf2 family protein